MLVKNTLKSEKKNCRKFLKSIQFDCKNCHFFFFVCVCMCLQLCENWIISLNYKKDWLYRKFVTTLCAFKMATITFLIHFFLFFGAYNFFYCFAVYLKKFLGTFFLSFLLLLSKNTVNFAFFFSFFFASSFAWEKKKDENKIFMNKIKKGLTVNGRWKLLHV